VGELFSNVQHGDSVFPMEQFWAPEEHLHPKGALVRSAVYEWWVPIQAVGRAGWIRPRDPKMLRGPSPFCFPTADSTIW
jgi:hypothetical protein